MDLEVNEDTLAMEAIHAVGPGGHFLAQKHTRKHVRDYFVRCLTQQIGPDGKFLDARQAARQKLDWILENHHPEPLEKEKQAELTRILAAADQELNKD
jgi:trimethylamine--corrinoid protein Co-methyltransferase